MYFIQSIDKDAVVATSKACEMLVLDLTLKAWQNMGSNSTRLTVTQSLLSSATLVLHIVILIYNF